MQEAGLAQGARDRDALQASLLETQGQNVHLQAEATRAAQQITELRQQASRVGTQIRRFQYGHVLTWLRTPASYKLLPMLISALHSSL